MNAMLAPGGYAWTVIRVEDREAYLSSLDRASTGQYCAVCEVHSGPGQVVDGTGVSQTASTGLRTGQLRSISTPRSNRFCVTSSIETAFELRSWQAGWLQRYSHEECARW